ncbi:phosphoglycerate dehydrogenase [Ornithinibacillus halophilus]|uniref:D-3-phosphoglycerate dehydrogenase n=1 Tax=Ornithinibacillus halophilus TaxID=930117 RepID=A0A1M5HT20_9BACI|nr:phosphoglycerate dehydrogenase [Ornithinibacillus halophilus]SHG19121.1 D-3-phosphoglycerate dehydrogenase [Ornithinibacillus halophilus]
MSFHVLITDPLHEEGLVPLKNHPDIKLTIINQRRSSNLKELIRDVDALIVRSQTQVTRDVLEHATRLKIIGRAGVGVDNIDLDAATERGIIVVNAPNGNTNSAAEHTMALLMSLARKIPQAYQALKNMDWDRKNYVGVELRNKTLGVIGLGRIGAEVAYRAKGQRMEIIAYDPFLTQEKAEKLGVNFGTLDEVLALSDFITIHTPLLNETKHLINTKAFQKMKKGVQIINCARGGIIDEEALYQAIISKKVTGAALDVFENEPFHHHKLLELPEVIATPHLGASTIEAQEMVAIDVSQDIIRYLMGEQIKNPVNLPSLPIEILNKMKPYFHLGEKLGTTLIHLVEQPIEEITLSYEGELAELEVSPITRTIVKSVLQRHLGDHVNDVNALYLAEKRGITVHENKSSANKGFTNLLKVEIKTNRESKSVSGTHLPGLGPRIVRLDEYRIDVIPEGHIIFIHHNDQPGVIGKIGSLLADFQINIATMQVDRSNLGGDAIMVLKVDKRLHEQELARLKELDEIKEIQVIDL